MSGLPASSVTFREGEVATAPPEARGLTRSDVRLLVAAPGSVAHRAFSDLPDLLEPGDVVVVNTSATLAAAVDVLRGDGRAQVLHVSGTLDDGSWVVEPRLPHGPARDGFHGENLVLPGNLTLRLHAPYPGPGAVGSRLWRAKPSRAVDHVTFLARHGRPIAYDYVEGRFPLAAYQNVWALHPGSAEMPSAGRPFTAELVVALVARGITVAPITLHCGVSSPEAHEPPLPERYDVPEDTARIVNSAVWAGKRVVAVGTTVVRALETCATEHGTVRPDDGWTDLVLGPDRPARVVTGLVSGLHPPEASHLLLLESVAGAELVQQAYAQAGDYLWHEFGDTMLFLPGPREPYSGEALADCA